MAEAAQNGAHAFTASLAAAHSKLVGMVTDTLPPQSASLGDVPEAVPLQPVSPKPEATMHVSIKPPGQATPASPLTSQASGAQDDAPAELMTDLQAELTTYLQAGYKLHLSELRGFKAELAASLADKALDVDEVEAWRLKAQTAKADAQVASERVASVASVAPTHATASSSTMYEEYMARRLERERAGAGAH